MVEAVLRGGESPPRYPSKTDSTDHGDCGGDNDGNGDDNDDNNGGNTLGSGSGRASGSTIGTAGAATAATVEIEPPLGSPWCDGGEGVAWEGLAAPAARLWAACRPSDPAQLNVLDKVLGDIVFAATTSRFEDVDTGRAELIGAT